MQRARSRLVLAALLALPAVPADAAPLDHLPVLAGDYFAIDSREANHRYHIYIRYPDGYADQPQQQFPIVYLLDGDSLFPHLASLQLFLHYDDKLPEALVVGVAYGSFDSPQNRRSQDFTDGATAFGNFLERELIPMVEGRVRARPDRRILFGQSRGGGYVLHSAFTNPDLFWGRIASNPTLDRLPALARRPTAGKRADLRLLVTSGANDRPQYRAPMVRWIAEMKGKQGLPWTLRTETIDGGTHAADAGRVYRLGMGWLLSEQALTGR